MPKPMIFFFLLIFAIAVGLLFVANKQLSNKKNALSPTPAALSSFTTDQKNPPAQPLPNHQQANQVTPPPTPTFEPYTQATYTAVLKTTKGDITLQLWHDVAPKTVENFLNKARIGFYNGLPFHRVENWVIQGGDPQGTGYGGGQMPTEFNDKPFVAGSLGQARANDPSIQNDAQFFITKQDESALNGQYTNYGIVLQGMDVVNNIKIGDKILGITVSSQ